MRKIKFRAWVKKEQRYKAGMHDWEFLQENFGMELNPRKTLFLLGINYPDDIVLMQFTGLKDKNGKEIYEGDTVLGDFWAFGTKKRNKYNVEYLDDEAGFNVGNIEDMKIIGNIYENPELLTQ